MENGCVFVLQPVPRAAFSPRCLRPPTTFITVHHRSSPGSDEWAPWQGPGARSGLWDWGDVQSASTSGFCYIF